MQSNGTGNGFKHRRRGGRANATGRSAGGCERHVRLHHWLLESPAYRHLSPVARALLVELYRLYNGSNNGDFFLSVRDAASLLNTGKNRAHRAFQELIELAFVAPHVLGSFNQKTGDATRWRLTEFGCGTELPTKEFMRWRLPPEKQNTVPLPGTVGPSRRDSRSL